MFGRPPPRDRYFWQMANFRNVTNELNQLTQEVHGLIEATSQVNMISARSQALNEQVESVCELLTEREDNREETISLQRTEFDDEKALERVLETRPPQFYEWVNRIGGKRQWLPDTLQGNIDAIPTLATAQSFRNTKKRTTHGIPNRVAKMSPSKLKARIPSPDATLPSTARSEMKYSSPSPIRPTVSPPVHYLHRTPSSPFFSINNEVRQQETKQRRVELWSQERTRQDELMKMIEEKEHAVEKRRTQHRTWEWIRVLTPLVFLIHVKRPPTKIPKIVSPTKITNRIKRHDVSKWRKVFVALRPLILFQVCINHRRQAMIPVKNIMLSFLKAAKFWQTVTSFSRRVRAAQRISLRALRRERIRAQLLYMQLESFVGLNWMLEFGNRMFFAVVQTLRDDARTRGRQQEIYRELLYHYLQYEKLASRDATLQVSMRPNTHKPQPPHFPLLKTASELEEIVKKIEANGIPTEMGKLPHKSPETYFRCWNLFLTLKWEKGLLVKKKVIVLTSPTATTNKFHLGKKKMSVHGLKFD
eukprot:PhF_6_TR40620/c0_g1_i1/m.60943